MTSALKILILEDNPEDAEIITRLLKKTMGDLVLRMAVDNTSFREALDEFDPDVVLSDNNLPGFSGSEALRLTQQRPKLISFILVTGTVSDEFAAGIIKSGADDYILKDRLSRLPTAIEAAVKQKRLERERIESAQKLAASEEKYRKLFFKGPLPKWIYDFETLQFLEVNEAAVRHYGYSETEFLNLTIGDVQLPENLAAFQEDIHQITEEPEIRKSTWTHVKKTGERIIIESAGHFIEFNNRRARLEILNDITERVRSEEALHAMEKKILTQKVQEQKKVTRAILKAQEKERSHIGRELHDNVNQILVSTKIHLDMAGENNAELNALIRYPHKLIENAIQEIRALTHGYVGPEKNIDLCELIQMLLDRLHDNFNIQTSLVYNISVAMDDDLKLNIYRIFQEQTSNIIRHAEAKRVTVSMESANSVIKIVIADDGKGFDPEKKRKGIGISNMINRIESFNGEVQIRSAPGKGVVITLSIPC